MLRKQLAGAARRMPMNDAVLLAATFRANEAIRPTRRDDDRPALLLSAVKPVKFRLAEPFLKLDLVVGHDTTP